jgi:hypothetical protein
MLSLLFFKVPNYGVRRKILAPLGQARMIKAHFPKLG